MIHAIQCANNDVSCMSIFSARTENSSQRRDSRD